MSVSETPQTFLSAEQAAEVRERFGTPCYVYDRRTLESVAKAALSFPAPFGYTLRYAMKANPSIGVLTLFRQLGLHIDASSDYEVERAIRAGFTPDQIQLTSQMPSRRLAEHVKRGVLFNACSLHQLESYGKVNPGGAVTVRLNPGLGSGGTNRTNTGGPASSFGIWHEYLPEVQRIAQQYNLKLGTVHSHIGSGSDPEVWKRVTRMTLDLVEQVPEAVRVNLGGGFKVGRMPGEISADLQDVGVSGDHPERVHALDIRHAQGIVGPQPRIGFVDPPVCISHGIGECLRHVVGNSDIGSAHVRRRDPPSAELTSP